MAGIADYRVILFNDYNGVEQPVLNVGTQDNVQIGVGQHADVKSFPLPKEMLVNEDAILAFRVTPTKYPSNLRFEVHVNGNIVLSTELQRCPTDNTPYRTIHIVLWGGVNPGGNHILRNDSSNTMRFQVLPGGSGTVNFADIVLWYKVSGVPSPR